MYILPTIFQVKKAAGISCFVAWLAPFFPLLMCRGRKLCLTYRNNEPSRHFERPCPRVMLQKKKPVHLYPKIDFNAD